jgi:hypothetical protein
MWSCYRDGMRTARALQRRCSVGFRTAVTAIERGWPERGWAALVDRLKFWEKQREAARQRQVAADAVAASDAGKTEAAKWREFQEMWLPHCRQAAGILGEMGKKLAGAVSAATFVRYRRVRKIIMVKGADGVERPQQFYEDQPFIDALAHTKAVQLWCTSMRDVPQVARFLLGPAIDKPEPSVPEFTPEQLAELGQGRLPAGVTEEMVGLALLHGSKVGGGGSE